MVPPCATCTDNKNPMPNEPTLSTSDEDVKTVHDMIEKIDIAMLTTVCATTGRLVSRPLSTQAAEEDGDVLFLNNKTSAVADDVRANPAVNVAYSSKKAWVSLSGHGTLVEDNAVVKELWSTGADMFMDDGPENPDNVVLKVHGDTATYWGGTSLAGTVAKTIGALRNKDGHQKDSGGPTTVNLP